MLKFQKQPLMRRVLLALAPIGLHSVWLYGARALGLAAAVFAAGVLAEWLVERKRSGKVSEAVLVTSALYALALPPRTPVWMALVGVAVAVFLAKGVYGGFGRNVFNPAVAGRLFVYISFATTLNASYSAPGGFGAGAVDVLASATPLARMRAGQEVGLWDLLLGNRAGAVGEGMVLLVLAAAVYLLVTKTASWRIMLATAASAAALNAALWFGGVRGALPMESLLAGSFLFVAVFMATDPVSAPKKKGSQLAYGALIGSAVVAIRTFSAFPEGTSFAILLGNSFASFFDEIASRSQAAKAARVGGKEAAGPAGAGTASAAPGEAAPVAGKGGSA
ncbi:MAG TPA: RnfABCDGE type electron transport complex subunit D [Spirochaetales bacterium]|nr:RnfABCDGE type electron transport complex subunit D [Spirochaetales bacterium]